MAGALLGWLAHPDQPVGRIDEADAEESLWKISNRPLGVRFTPAISGPPPGAGASVSISSSCCSGSSERISIMLVPSCGRLRQPVAGSRIMMASSAEAKPTPTRTDFCSRHAIRSSTHLPDDAPRAYSNRKIDRRHGIIQPGSRRCETRRTKRNRTPTLISRVIVRRSAAGRRQRERISSSRWGSISSQFRLGCGGLRHDHVGGTAP